MPKTKTKTKTKTLKTVIEWKRAKKDETMCAHRQTWESRCGRYKVIESVSKFSEMGTTYYAILCGDGEKIISRHRKRSIAESACEKYKPV